MRKFAYLSFVALLIASCQSRSTSAPPAEVDSSTIPSKVTSSALEPSTISSSSLAESQVEPIEQVLSDLNAQRTEGGQIRITLPEDILFNFDEATIRADARTPLAKVAEAISYYSSAPVQIEGHTDSKGDTAYNRDLSERRADAVANYLAEIFALSLDLISTEGLGESQPVAENENPDGSDNPEGRQQNRRVEIVIETRE